MWEGGSIKYSVLLFVYCTPMLLRCSVISAAFLTRSPCSVARWNDVDLELIAATGHWDDLDRLFYTDRSFIKDMFGGQHQSMTSCSGCGGTRSTCEDFTTFNLHIPLKSNTQTSQLLVTTLKGIGRTTAKRLAESNYFAPVHICADADNVSTSQLQSEFGLARGKQVAAILGGEHHV